MPRPSVHAIAWLGAAALGCQLVSGSPSLEFKTDAGGAAGGYPGGGSSVASAGAGSVCTPNTSKPCPYLAATITENVGICKAGTGTCNATGSGWSSCTGEVTPDAHETCSDGQDNDCDGQTDEGCIAAGASHTCVVVAGGGVKCWGKNFYGQLGDGTQTDSHIPVAVKDTSGAIGVTAGAAHTCGVFSDGHVACWGYNIGSALGGDPATTPAGIVPSPVKVTDIAGATAIAADAVGTNQACTCAIVSEGKVACWGSSCPGNQKPLPIDNVTGAAAIGVGLSHACAAVADAVQCWGSSNAQGQLGLSAEDAAKGYGSALGLSEATTVTCHFHQSCSLVPGGDIYCWGYNASGQLGTGITGNVAVPTLLAISEPATGITLGQDHTCALLAGGTVTCWGDNDSGQLGTTETSLMPGPTATNITDAVSIAAGQAHTCALRKAGGVRCWGKNEYGQLGNGSVSGVPGPVPVDVIGLP